MAALLKGSALLIASLALLAVPAAAQLRPAPLEEIFESYNDCFAATNGGSLAPAELEKLGWTRATITGDDGEAVADAPIIFGHGERAPIIMLSNLEGEGICLVNARIEGFEVFDEFKAAFGGKLPKPKKNGEITYQAEGRVVQIAPTGSSDKPSLRLVVGTRMESK